MIRYRGTAGPLALSLDRTPRAGRNHDGREKPECSGRDQNRGPIRGRTGSPSTSRTAPLRGVSRREQPRRSPRIPEEAIGTPTLKPSPGHGQAFSEDQVESERNPPKRSPGCVGGCQLKNARMERGGIPPVSARSPLAGNAGPWQGSGEGTSLARGPLGNHAG